MGTRDPLSASRLRQPAAGDAMDWLDTVTVSEAPARRTSGPCFSTRRTKTVQIRRQAQSAAAPGLLSSVSARQANYSRHSTSSRYSQDRRRQQAPAANGVAGRSNDEADDLWRTERFHRLLAGRESLQDRLWDSAISRHPSLSRLHWHSGCSVHRKNINKIDWDNPRW